jgi:hypothetical protein
VIRHLHLLDATGVGRTETYDGREHLVVPVVALIGDNVIHAVNAPSAEWVPASVLSAAGWDGRPLMLGHPAKDGRQISANDPRVMEKQGFGFMSASKMNGKRLGTEAWIDVARLEKLGAVKMLEDLRAGKPIEVSVGAFVQTRENPGTHLGKSYKHEWASIAPDHLAFLPESTGACSVEMGCGANRHAMRVMEDGTLQALRDIPQSERDKMSDDDFAGPDQSFPIKTQADVDAAKHLVGKAANPDAVKAKVITIAKRKGLTIPDAWQSRGAQMNAKIKKLLGPLLKALDGDEAVDDDPDEVAETISYTTMRDLIVQAEASLASGKTHVEALIAENGKGDDEGIEDAHLEALVAMCVQLYGTTNGVIKLATSCLAPDGNTSPMAYMEQRAAAGARHNKSDQAIIQQTHDNAVQLGADCSGMKTAAGTPCGCGGHTAEGEVQMTRKEHIDALLALKGAEFTDDQKKGIDMLPDATVATLHTLASKTPADSIIQAKAAADAALAGHAHGLNAMDEADKAKKAAKDAAAAAKAKEDAADGGADDDEEDASGKKVKAAQMKAAQAAGFDTIEAHEQDIFLKKNPTLKALVDKQQKQDADRKAALVKALEGGKLTAKQLEAKPLDELETLASYAGVEDEKVDYSGRGLPRAAAEGDVYANPPDGYAIALEKRRLAAVK